MMRDERNLNKIEFILENCEVISIPAEHVHSLLIGSAVKRMYGAFIWSKDGKNVPMREKTIADNIRIIIESVGNVLYETAWGDKYEHVFDRFLQYNDIVCIELYFSGSDEPVSFEPEWRDATEGGEENKYQKSILLEDGSLIIAISKHELENMLYY